MQNRYLKLIWIILVVAAILAVLSWLLFRTADLVRQNGQMTGQIADRQLSGSGDGASRTEVAKLKEVQAILDRYIVGQDDQISVISDLENLARTTNVKYTLKNALLTDKLALDIEVSGTYRDLYWFIRLIEEKGYWVSFEKLALSRAALADGSWSGILTITVPAEK
ncbi:MAG: hypothetical protein NTY66_03030 [Candidatus Vogelbacteria bacterium]|nr:hypothetical protein [Candidatus Vogelbacteria bacterium]